MEFPMESFEQPVDLSSSGGGDSNAVILPNKRRSKRKCTNQECERLGTRKTPKMTKSQERKLQKLEEEKGKALLLSKSIEALGTNALGETGSIASLKAAFEALAGKTELNFNSDGKQPISVTLDACCHKSHPILGKKSEVDNDNSPGGLHVLPLYAMLPASSQLRIFEEVKEGERLVVVAINVAETSLTIPGVKYIVDTGRVKVKNYNSSNGMETYNIEWISKASADQRKGRAGRIGPEHCYRLYSSAVYNNEFPDFSPPEILKVPEIYEY